MNYNCATPEYRKYLPDRKFGRLPHTLNTNLFKNLGLKRDIDVMCVESYSKTYPLKSVIYRELKKSQSFKVFTSLPHILSFTDYVHKINQSKIFVFGNVNMPVGESKIMVFPMAKIYEIMGCETLCMMDTPDEAEELHFVPDYNFISIDTENFLNKIQYWLENEDERLKIARRGYETCLKYHTVEVRTRELKKMLEEIIRK
jgi:glycosyltransferase involved in cell wall biosynthesis